MHRLACLSLILLCAGCPQGTPAKSVSGRDTTAAPARGATTSALLPPSVSEAKRPAASQGATSVQSLTPPAASSSTSAPMARAQVLAGVSQVVLPDDLPGAQTLLLGEPQSGVLESPQDSDDYLLELRRDHPLVIEAHGYGEVSLELYAPDGRLLCQGTRSLEHRAQLAGVYVVRAKAELAHGLHYTLDTR